MFEDVNKPEGWSIISKNYPTDDGRTDIQVIERVKEVESHNLREGESSNRDQTLYTERIRYSTPTGSNREASDSGSDARHSRRRETDAC